ncbi:MAG: redoxin domain-containing protein [Deltaproteobacteria bacterium]|nr:redoxin domain-containing protein [Deltaproteobacteria bacterium]
MKMMSVCRLVLAVIMVAFVIFPAGISAAGPPAVGGALPDVSLSAPSDRGERSYLGVSGTFKIPQIKAQVLIIEIFSMYCPYCQKDAPKVNELYQKIEGNPALKGKMKIIGVGAGNSAFEVATFKKKYNVPFPLFADPDFKIYEQLGQLRTPYFIGLNINADGSHRIFFSKLGAFEGVDAFLESMIRLSGINEGEKR